jgi:predicted RNA polymerase sigma factor
MMLTIDSEWEELRAGLSRDFDEDTAQQALLELLEAQAKGAVILNPRNWCRKVASRRKTDKTRKEITERRGKATLTAYGVTYDASTKADDARRRKRRERKRRAEKAA